MTKPLPSPNLVVWSFSQELIFYLCFPCIFWYEITKCSTTPLLYYPRKILFNTKEKINLLPPHLQNQHNKNNCSCIVKPTTRFQHLYKFASPPSSKWPRLEIPVPLWFKFLCLYIFFIYSYCGGLYALVFLLVYELLLLLMT